MKGHEFYSSETVPIPYTIITLSSGSYVGFSEFVPFRRITGFYTQKGLQRLTTPSLHIEQNPLLQSPDNWSYEQEIDFRPLPLLELK